MLGFLDFMPFVWISQPSHSLVVYLILLLINLNSYGYLSLYAEIIARFEQDPYFVDEMDGQFEVCVLLEGTSSISGVTIQVMSQNNNSAEGIIIMLIQL